MWPKKTPPKQGGGDAGGPHDETKERNSVLLLALLNLPQLRKHTAWATFRLYSGLRGSWSTPWHLLRVVSALLKEAMQV